MKKRITKKLILGLMFPEKLLKSLEEPPNRMRECPYR